MQQVCVQPVIQRLKVDAGLRRDLAVSYPALQLRTCQQYRRSIAGQNLCSRSATWSGRLNLGSSSSCHVSL